MRHRGEVDETALEELDLYAENTGEIYNQKKSILENVRRRLKNGTYSPALAPKLWMYWVESAAKRYGKEFGSGSGRVDAIFNLPTREALARRLAKRYASGAE
jgi:hypothetical protein